MLENRGKMKKSTYAGAGNMRMVARNMAVCFVFLCVAIGSSAGVSNDKYTDALFQFGISADTQALKGAIESLAKKYPSAYGDGKAYLTELRQFESELPQIKSGLEGKNEEALESFRSFVGFRRKVLFQDNPLLDFKDLIFIKRDVCPPEQLKGNHMCDQFFGFNAMPGGGLFRLKDAFGEAPQVVDLTEKNPCRNGRFRR